MKDSVGTMNNVIKPLIVRAIDYVMTGELIDTSLIPLNHSLSPLMNEYRYPTECLAI